MANLPQSTGFGPTIQTPNTRNSSGMSPVQQAGASTTGAKGTDNERINAIFSDIASRLGNVTNTRTSTQQGLFDSFGNNFLTRSASATISGVSDMASSFLGGEANQKKSMEQILEEQGQTLDGILTTIQQLNNNPSSRELVDLTKSGNEQLITLNRVIKQFHAVEEMALSRTDKLLSEQKQLLEGILHALEGGLHGKKTPDINSDTFPGLNNTNQPVLEFDPTVTKKVRHHHAAEEVTDVDPKVLSKIHPTDLQDVIGKSFTPYTKEKVVAEEVPLDEVKPRKNVVSKETFEDITPKGKEVPDDKDTSTILTKQKNVLEDILFYAIASNKSLEQLAIGVSLTDKTPLKEISLAKETNGKGKELLGVKNDGEEAGGMLETILSALGGESIASAFKKITEVAGDLWKKLKDGVGKITEAIGEFVSKVWEGAKEIAGKVASGISDAWEATKAKGGELIGKAGEFLSEAVKGTKEFGGKVFEGVSEAGGKVMEALNTSVGKVAEGAGEVVSKGSKFARAVPGLGEALIAADVAYHGYQGYKNSNEILDKPKDHEATFSEKAAATGGAVLDTLSFGLIKKENAAKYLDDTGEKIKHLFDVSESRADIIEKLGKAIDNTKKDTASKQDVVNPIVNTTNVSTQNVYPSRHNPFNPERSFNRYLDTSLQLG